MSSPRPFKVLGIQQVVMLGELSVNRMLDNFVPQG